MNDSTATQREPRERRSLAWGAGRAAGRGSLVRRAVFLLVHYPQIADKVADPMVLNGIDRPGVPLLIEMLNELQTNPCPNTAVLLERWRGRPNEEHLASLAVRTSHLHSAEEAATELLGAVEGLANEVLEPRYRQLLHKRSSEGLTEAERAELQRLVVTVGRKSGASEPRT